jgi:single-strand DNA-binding protein
MVNKRQWKNKAGLKKILSEYSEKIIYKSEEFKMTNVAVVTGRICNDIEVKKTQQGVSVCRFTVAVSRDYAKQGEQRQADFIDILAWRNTSEFIGKYFQKGSMIEVVGSIQTGSYEKDGIKRKTFEIVADKVSFSGSKSESNAPSEEPTVDYASSVDDDDLPF